MTDAGLQGAITSSLARIEGFAQWKNFVREHFSWLEITSSARPSFDAEVQSHHLGASVLATIRSADTQVRRTPQLAVQADAGYVKFMWQLTGAMEIEQDRRRAVITPGEACVCETARPYRVSLMENSHFAVLTLPYDALPGWEQVSQTVCGDRIQDVVTTRAALGALMALLSSPPVDDPEGMENVMRAIQWMLSASLRRSASLASLAGSADRAGTRIDRAQMYMLEHIGDPSLGPDELASALHMSRRALFMLFKEYRMTPGRMIHDLRLERCKKALCDPSQESRGVTAIAVRQRVPGCRNIQPLVQNTVRDGAERVPAKGAQALGVKRFRSGSQLGCPNHSGKPVQYKSLPPWVTTPMSRKRSPTC